jgi:hypothetical protein
VMSRETGVRRAATVALAALSGFALPGFALPGFALPGFALSGDTSVSDHYFAENLTEPSVGLLKRHKSLVGCRGGAVCDGWAWPAAARPAGRPRRTVTLCSLGTRGELFLTVELGRGLRCWWRWSREVGVSKLAI